MTDSESDILAPDWEQVVGGRRKKKGGRGPGSGQKAQDERLLHMPGALGLLSYRGRETQHQQQQQFRGSGPGGNYPKVIAKTAGFRQVNCCSINFGNVKVGPNKTLPSDYELNFFINHHCKINPIDITKVSREIL